jgi:hypothetical protein
MCKLSSAPAVAHQLVFICGQTTRSELKVSVKPDPALDISRCSVLLLWSEDIAQKYLYPHYTCYPALATPSFPAYFKG